MELTEEQKRQEEKAKREIAKRSKLYTRNTSKRMQTVFVFILITTYAFFFFSDFILPHPIAGKDSVTQLNKQEPFAENRSVSLVSANYSHEQETMEVVLNFINENYDNVDDYYYTLETTGTSSKRIVIKEAFHEELFTVLRLSDLPKGYEELTLYFAPKTVDEDRITDDITGSITLNKNNVSEVGYLDLEKTKTAYLTERMDGVILGYVTMLSKQKEKLTEFEAKVTALEDENKSIEKNKNYMTDEELMRKEQKIRENEEAMVEAKEEITAQQKKIKQTEDDIKEAKEKREKLE